MHSKAMMQLTSTLIRRTIVFKSQVGNLQLPKYSVHLVKVIQL